MTPEQHDKYISEIKHVIQDTVNGKIDKIDRKIDQYIKDDTAWKENADPVIRTLNNLTGTGKFLIMLFGGLGTIAGAYLVLKGIFIPK